MPDTALIIIGSGGHACVVAEAAGLAGWHIAGHVSPEAGDSDLLGDWLGGDAALDGLLAQGMMCALGLGFVNAATATRRASILNKLDLDFLATVVHPLACVSPSAKLGAGCFVAANSVVGTRAVLGLGVILNTGGIVEHHNKIGQNSHIATGARVTGNVIVGDDVLIGAGSIIRQGLIIGDAAIVGAGCVVLSDLPAGVAWVGNPGHAL